MGWRCPWPDDASRPGSRSGAGGRPISLGAWTDTAERPPTRSVVTATSLSRSAWTTSPALRLIVGGRSPAGLGTSRRRSSDLPGSSSIHSPVAPKAANCVIEDCPRSRGCCPVLRRVKRHILVSSCPMARDAGLGDLMRMVPRLRLLGIPGQGCRTIASPVWTIRSSKVAEPSSASVATSRPALSKGPTGMSSKGIDAATDRSSTVMST